MSNLSPAPGTPQTKTKAYVALAVAIISGVATALLGTVAPDTQFYQWLTYIVAVVGAVGTALGVAQTANKPL